MSERPFLNGIDHIGFSAMGAGIAIEVSGLADIPWYFYAIVFGVLICWTAVAMALRGEFR